MTEPVRPTESVTVSAADLRRVLQYVEERVQLRSFAGQEMLNILDRLGDAVLKAGWPNRLPNDDKRIPHNHLTRDIKPKGQCPGCDAYCRSEQPPATGA